VCLVTEKRSMLGKQNLQLPQNFCSFDYDELQAFRNP
jgi:hypothetical protein